MSTRAFAPAFTTRGLAHSCQRSAQVLGHGEERSTTKEHPSGMKGASFGDHTAVHGDAGIPPTSMPDYSQGPSALDKAARLFFFTEIIRGSQRACSLHFFVPIQLMCVMFAGMWIVLEQFFRPPYVSLAISSRRSSRSLADQSAHPLLLDHHVPIRKGSHEPSIQRRTRPPKICIRRRALHW